MDVLEEYLPEDLQTLFDNVDFGSFDIAKKENSRFANVSTTDVNDFLKENQNSNTLRKTTGDMKVFCQFLQSNDEYRNPEHIPPFDLNRILCQFILAVRKKDGSEYEPVSLRSFVSSIDRYLKQNEYAYSIIKDIQFSKFRETLSAKQKQLKSIGKGNKPRTAEELSDRHIEAIYEAGNLGSSDPTALINSLWLVCTTHFGMRTGLECKNLQWGDIELKEEDNEEYLLYSSERQTKTRTGQNVRDIRLTKPRAYALPDQTEKDPVFLYKLYRSKRPAETLTDDSPFFLAINHNRRKDSPWFKTNAMGINKLYGIMRSMKSGTDIDENQRITPYSVRKHLVQKLRDTGLPPTEIIQVTGHRNVNSINNYSKMNVEQQKNISHVLSTGKNEVMLRKPTSTRSPSATASSASSLPATPVSPQSQNMSYTASHSHSQSRNFLTSIMTGNSIHGNVTINVTPDVVGITCPHPSQSRSLAHPV